MWVSELLLLTEAGEGALTVMNGNVGIGDVGAKNTSSS